MRDIELKSAIMRIDGMPGGTHKIMVMYDSRGWAIRCYDEDGNKLTTMVTDNSINEFDEATITLIRQ